MFLILRSRLVVRDDQFHKAIDSDAGEVALHVCLGVLSSIHFAYCCWIWEGVWKGGDRVVDMRLVIRGVFFF